MHRDGEKNKKKRGGVNPALNGFPFFLAIDSLLGLEGQNGNFVNLFEASKFVFRGH
jgi:hypothetical protein